MRHIIPTQDWATHLAATVAKMQNGDTVIVATEAQIKLAQRAIGRQRPDLHTFAVLAGPAENAPDWGRKMGADFRTKRRADDWIASVVGQPGIWECGRTEDEAIRKLLHTLEVFARDCACCVEPITNDTACWAPTGKSEICPFCDAAGCDPGRGVVKCRE